MSQITPVYPEKVIFRCLSRRCDSTPDQTLGMDVWKVESTKIPTPGVKTGVVEFSETALALFTSSADTPTNQEELQKLADQFTTDYLAWKQTNIDQTFAGICKITPTGIYQDIEFDYNIDMCSTRVTSFPYDYPMQQLGHQVKDPDGNCLTTDENIRMSDKTPCIEMFGPPVPTEIPGQSKFDQFLVCKEDGRYKQTFQKSVTFECSCGQGTRCGCHVKICVVGCINPGVNSQVIPLPGATITISGDLNATFTTGPDGCALVDLCVLNTGNRLIVVSVKVTKDGYYDFEGNMTWNDFDCIESTEWPGPREVLLIPNTSVQFSMCVSKGICQPRAGFYGRSIFGCQGGCPIVGATVNVNGKSYTTDINGCVFFPIAEAKEYGFTVSAQSARYSPIVGTFNVLGLELCRPFCISVALGAASGYWWGGCAENGCISPIPSVLHLTDSGNGAAISISHSGGDDTVGCGGTWEGSYTWSFPGFCQLTPSLSTATYTYPFNRLAACNPFTFAPPFASQCSNVRVIVTKCADGNHVSPPLNIDPCCHQPTFLTFTTCCSHTTITDGNCLDDLTINSSEPFDMTQTIHACDCNCVANPILPSLACTCQKGTNDFNFGACYGAGASPTIGITE